MILENKIIRLTKKDNGYKVSILDKSLNLLKIGAVIVREVDAVWIEERLSGLIDNANKLFTTSYNYVTSSVQIFWNGIKQENGIDFYERSGNSIELNFTPSNTAGYEDRLITRYRK